MKAWIAGILLVGSIVFCGDLLAQEKANPTSAPIGSAHVESAGIESLNLQGAAIRMPPFSDTVLGADTEFRRELYSKGLMFRSNSTLSYMQNTLDAPVPSDEQVYMGQRPFVRLMANPMLAYDMRAFHLHNAQLFVASGLNWVTWDAAGPNTSTVNDLYLYSAFANRHVEIKLGYISNDFEFVGLQVGGALSTGSQGVYAVLPYEVGLSRYPLQAPSFNLNLQGPHHLYFKTAAQRSLDPGGGGATIKRNSTGLRFIPKGDKLVNVFEVGFNRTATPDTRQTWLRAGYIHNTTRYPSLRTGLPTSGNFCAYVLGDRQLTSSDPGQPNRGVYAGASAMGTSTDLNAYTRYYELRIYDEGPFKSRPSDTASLVSSYTTYSRYMIQNLQAHGQTAWRNSTSITASYTFRVSRGAYLSAGLIYHPGPAITPRVPNALIGSLVMNYFF